MSYHIVPNYINGRSVVEVKNRITDVHWMRSLWSWADKFSIKKEVLPRSKKGLQELTSLKLIAPFFNFIVPNHVDDIEKKYIDAMFASATKINTSYYFAAEIGQMKHLEELCISMSPVENLPDNIVYLQNLKKLCLCENINLILTDDQKLWIRDLELKGVDVSYDDDLLYRTKLINVRPSF